MNERDPNDWLPSEAIFAFVGWLTCREERTVMSATSNCTPAVDAVTAFIKRHGLKEPREGFHEAIISETVES